ncbi:MAG TPA: NAD(P)-dependent oxidoreductase [Steroidobacter sp.]|nr:NAD(P)-dependent oxidoreductase [Steroidobacter sp.]
MHTTDSETPLRLLVTGATGFIGSRLCLYAHRLGLDLRATGRAFTPIERERWSELQAAGVAVHEGVLQDEGLVERVLDGCDAVIHLAAAQHESGVADAYFRSINVDAVRLLLDKCAQLRVRRFVYGGTIGVYGGLGQSGPYDERTPPNPLNIYTRTKLEAESLVRSYAQRLETVIVRIPETYGPGDERLTKLFRAIDRGRFVMIGDGENRRQCLHVTDLARGLLLAATRPCAAGETFVFAGGEVMSTNDMVREIAAALGRPAPRLRAPMWPFALAARICETALPPLHISPPLHGRRLDFFRTSFVFDTAKAQTMLGFKAEIDFRSGLADTLRWCRSHGRLAPQPADGVARAQST